MEEFKLGDIVMLKSGSPSMTIIHVNSDGMLTCRWYDGKQFHTEFFPTGSVMRNDEEFAVGIGIA